MKAKIKYIAHYIVGLSIVPLYGLVGYLLSLLDKRFSTTIGEAITIPVLLTISIFLVYFPKNKRFRIGLLLGYLFILLPATIYFILKIKGGIYIIIGYVLIGIYISVVDDMFSIIKHIMKKGISVTKNDIRTIFFSFIILLIAFTFFFTGMQIQKDKFLRIQNPTYLFVDILYFNVVSFTTIGYGDIIPISASAKILVIIEDIIMFFHFALGVGILMKGVSKTEDNEEK